MRPCSVNFSVKSKNDVIPNQLPFDPRLFKDVPTFKSKLKAYSYEKVHDLEKLVIKSDYKVQFSISVSNVFATWQNLLENDVFSID